jgi:hypothetical protein
VTVHHLTTNAHHPGALHDVTGEASRRLGTTDTSAAVYLIRPDGHVAYRDRGDLAGLHAYLSRWLNRP